MATDNAGGDDDDDDADDDDDDDDDDGICMMHAESYIKSIDMA